MLLDESHDLRVARPVQETQQLRGLRDPSQQERDDAPLELRVGRGRQRGCRCGAGIPLACVLACRRGQERLELREERLALLQSGDIERTMHRPREALLPSSPQARRHPGPSAVTAGRRGPTTVYRSK